VVAQNDADSFGCCVQNLCDSKEVKQGEVYWRKGKERAIGEWQAREERSKRERKRGREGRRPRGGAFRQSSTHQHALQPALSRLLPHTTPHS
jgi:hypothetical protein